MKWWRSNGSRLTGTTPIWEYYEAKEGKCQHGGNGTGAEIKLPYPFEWGRNSHTNSWGPKRRKA